MRFFDRPLSEVTAEDVHQLVKDAVFESDWIDFKSDWYDHRDPNWKDKLLADVSAFANKRGGFIAIGVAETDQRASAVIGVPNSGLEDRLDQIKKTVRHGLQPRPPEIMEKVIDVGESKVVVLLEIPRSYALPHGFSKDGFPRFYYRAAGQNVPMDVNDLRNSFFGTRTTEAELMHKVDQELAAPDLPYGIEGLRAGPVVIAHILPYSATTREGIDVNLVARRLNERSYLLDDLRLASRWRFDGPTQRCEVNGMLYSEVAFMRSGIVRLSSGCLLTSCGRMEIGTIDVVRICEALDRCKLLILEAGASGPAILSLAILRARGLTLANAAAYTTECSEEELRCLPAYIEHLDVPSKIALRPQFDAIWNSMGSERCFAFDSDGNLKDPRKPRS